MKNKSCHSPLRLLHGLTHFSIPWDHLRGSSLPSHFWLASPQPSLQLSFLRPRCPGSLFPDLLDWTDPCAFSPWTGSIPSSLCPVSWASQPQLDGAIRGQLCTPDPRDRQMRAFQIPGKAGRFKICDKAGFGKSLYRPLFYMSGLLTHLPAKVRTETLAPSLPACSSQQVISHVEQVR